MDTLESKEKIKKSLFVKIGSYLHTLLNLNTKSAQNIKVSFLIEDTYTEVLNIKIEWELNNERLTRKVSQNIDVFQLMSFKDPDTCIESICLDFVNSFLLLDNKTKLAIPKDIPNFIDADYKKAFDELFIARDKNKNHLNILNMRFDPHGFNTINAKISSIEID